MSATVEVHSLNLSPRYAPSWGAWEIAREIISNAIDADPNYKVTAHGSDRLEIYTNTVPDLAELFVIGEGTKAPGGTTIGQFGEGFKLSALTITRMRGASITVEMPTCYIGFEFRENLGVEVLHAIVEPKSTLTKGMSVLIDAQGIANSFEGKILDNRMPGCLQKTSTFLNVYCKGIWITQVDAKSCFDWNVADLEINRDRDFAELSKIAGSVSRAIQQTIDAKMADAFVLHCESWECDKPLRSLVYYSNVCNALGQAWERRFNGKVFPAGQFDEHRKDAERFGNKFMQVERGLFECLKAAGIKTAVDLIPLYGNIDYIDADKYADQIAWLRTFDVKLGLPDFTVRVFPNTMNAIAGFADLEERRVCLNEKLFSGSKDRLAGTYLHEAAHITSGAKDETRAFEMALTEMLGTLAAATTNPLEVE